MPKSGAVFKLTLKPCSGCGKPTPSHIQVCESCQEREIDVPVTEGRATFPTRW